MRNPMGLTPGILATMSQLKFSNGLIQCRGGMAEEWLRDMIARQRVQTEVELMVIEFNQGNRFRRHEP